MKRPRLRPLPPLFALCALAPCGLQAEAPPGATAELWAEVATWEGRVASSPRDSCSYPSLLYHLERAFEAEIRNSEERTRETWTESRQPASRWRLERDETLAAAYQAWSEATPDDPRPFVERLVRLGSPEERRLALPALAIRFPGDLLVVEARLDQLLVDHQPGQALALALAATGEGDDVVVYRRLRNHFPEASPEVRELNRWWLERQPKTLELRIDQLRIEVARGTAPADLAPKLDRVLSELAAASTADLARESNGFPGLCVDLGRRDEAAALECLTRLHGLIADHPELPPGEPWEGNFSSLRRQTRRSLAQALARAGRSAEVARLDPEEDPDLLSSVVLQLSQESRCAEAVELLALEEGEREVSDWAAGQALSALASCHETPGAVEEFERRLPGLSETGISYLPSIPPPLFQALWAELGRRAETPRLLALRVGLARDGRARGWLPPEALETALERWRAGAPEDPEARWSRYREALLGTKLDLARDSFEEALRLEPADTRRALAEGQSLFWAAHRLERHDVAESIASRLLALSETPRQRAQAHELLGRSASARGRIELALEHYRQYFPLRVRFEDPSQSDTDYLKLLGLTARFEELERYLALAYRHHAARWRPVPVPTRLPRVEDPFTHRTEPPPDYDRFLGEAYLRIDQPHRALPYLEEALGRFPADEALLASLRRALFEAGRGEEAEKLLTAGPEIEESGETNPATRR